MQKKYTLGIDVGGTFTDGVLVNSEGDIVFFHKVPTSFSITESIQSLLDHEKFQLPEVNSVRISTTHGLNALLQGHPLYKVGVLRLMGHAPDLIPVAMGWPEHLKKIVVGQETLRGGYECDGRPISEIDREEILGKALKLLKKGAERLAVVGAFSPLYQDQEKEVCQLLEEQLPQLPACPSFQCGGMGILERENGAVLNLALQSALTSAFSDCENLLKERGVHQNIFWIHNQGGCMTLDEVRSYPLRTLASGPSNSLLGGAKLAGFQDCCVIDIGGTSTDAGIVRNGFLRLRHHGFTIAGVRIGSVSSDVSSINLGGGTFIQKGILSNRSAGKTLFETHTDPTLTDAAICAGQLSIPGFPLKKMTPSEAKKILQQAANLIVKLYKNLDPEEKYPCVLVGGGSSLFKGILPFVTSPKGSAIANAYGAAVAERVHTWCRTLSLEDREQVVSEAIERVLKEAEQLNIKDPRVVHLQVTPYHYIPGSKAKILIQVSGALKEIL